MRDRLRDLDANLLIGIGGRPSTVGQWLADHRDDIASDLVVNASQSHHKDDSLSAVANDRLRRPIFLPTWKHQFTVPLGTNLNAKEQRQRDQGIRPDSNSARPLIAGEQVIVRTLDAIHAFSQATG